MEKEILNMEEAAELFNVSIKTFIKLLREEKVPARKIGREWRFSRKALIEWLSSGDSQQYSSSESDTREFFDRVATEWESIRSDCHFDNEVVDRLLGAGILKNNMTLVDLGAGDGYLSRTVSPHVGSVIAIDISGAMLEELSKKAAKQGLTNIRTIISDGCDTPLADQSADIVCANMFLHHIDEPVMAIKEAYRVLKPGGVFFLADLNKHGNREFSEKMHDAWQGFTQKEIYEWFTKCGFSILALDVIERKDSGKKIHEGIFILIAKKRNEIE
ncbi:MAG: methyltransferase domain-containing protein [Bacillota bacterium]